MTVGPYVRIFFPVLNSNGIFAEFLKDHLYPVQCPAYFLFVNNQRRCKSNDVLMGRLARQSVVFPPDEIV